MPMRPRNPGGDWPESLRARLYEERVVSLFGRLDDEAVTGAAAELWSLDALGDEPISLLLSVSSSTVSAATALLDVLDVIGVEVSATCIGGITGPAVAVLAGARHRQAAPSARFVLRDESVRFEGSYRDLEQSVRDHHAQRNELFGRLAEATGGRRSLGDVLADFDRGLTLSAEEAQEYGLVERVAPSKHKVVPLPRPATPFGFHWPDTRR
ncbi:MAG TPA: ATP-dependent Clp protease proteolytic subunit [Acidimicrobiales bacterium]|nr:ATP-dependent Clp protease proteolytic subunit [Acidimicrobiales bacterium]